MLDNQDNYNVAAMYKALVTIRERLVAAYMSESEFMQLSPNKPLIDLIDAALSKPPRQCDVGTADEQEKRFEKFCDSHKWVDDEGANACSSDCPLYKTMDCALHWTQMSYEDEQRGEGK